MICNSNFFMVIIIILILILLYLNLPSDEKFQNNPKCSDIPSGTCSSTLCPAYCKASLSSDGDKCYCVDIR